MKGVNRKLRNEVKRRPCLVCSTTINIDPCHIKSVGAGGKDDKFNLLSLCRRHHSIQHCIGWERFLEMYPNIKTHLEELGWEMENINGRFIMTHHLG